MSGELQHSPSEEIQISRSGKSVLLEKNLMQEMKHIQWLLRSYTLLGTYRTFSDEDMEPREPKASGSSLGKDRTPAVFLTGP